MKNTRMIPANVGFGDEDRVYRLSNWQVVAGKEPPTPYGLASGLTCILTRLWQNASPNIGIYHAGFTHDASNTPQENLEVTIMGYGAAPEPVVQEIIQQTVAKMLDAGWACFDVQLGTAGVEEAHLTVTGWRFRDAVPPLETYGLPVNKNYAKGTN